MAPQAIDEDQRRAFGWKVVWVAFAVAVFAWGIGFYGPPVLLQALHAQRGWAISTISAAISTHFLLSAAIVAYLPDAHRRFGLANVTLAGIAATALGALAWGNAQAPWQLFPAALVSGAGWAATSGAAINAMVSPWFDRERPAALSMAFNGASVGGVIFGPLWTGLISQLGIPVASMVVGAGIVAILSPLALGYLRASPVGQGNREIRNTAASVAPAAPKPLMTRGALLGDRRFATMSAGFALGLLAQVGLFAHFFTRLVPVLGETNAAWALSLTTACAVAGRTLLGKLLGDRDRRRAAALNFAIQATGVVLLMLGEGPVPLLAGCVLFGLGVGNLISLPPLIAQKEFDPADVATVVALVTALNQSVFAFAPALFGALRDLTGTYTLAFAVAACLQVAAALVVGAGRRR